MAFSPRPRAAASAVAIAALTVAALSQPAHADDEPLRWLLADTKGYVFQLEGAGVEALADGFPIRTLFGADLADGRVPREPVGRVHDLLFHYLFQLPKEPLKNGKLVFAVDDNHIRFPPSTGPVRVTGEGQARARGGKTTIGWKLDLKGNPPATAVGQPAPFESGSLVATAVFHDKRGALLEASFSFTYRARGEDKTFEGKLALKDAIELSTPGEKRAVEEAVKRALAVVLKPYLTRKEWARMGDHKMGHLALALYAALHAGLPAGDPVARAAFEDLEKLPPEHTYSVALAIMALEARTFERGKDSRDASGQTVSRFRKGEVAGRDKALIDKLARWLIEARNPGDGTWSYGPHDPNREGAGMIGDHSNTQFAVLALHAAARSGVEIPRAIWEEIARHFVKLQMQGNPYEPRLDFERGSPFRDDPAASGGAGGAGAGTTGRGADGQDPKEVARRARGFDYSIVGGWTDYSSMSAAGTSSLAIAYRWLRDAAGVDPKLLQRVRAGVLDGLAWLELHHTMRHNWPDHGWPYYHLYSLEKAFEVAQVEALGGHDWWGEGAKELLLREDPKGGWQSQNPVETALAVLFLTRATQEPVIEIRGLERAITGGRAEDKDAEDAVLIEGLGIVRAADVAAAVEVEDAGLRKERLALLDQAVAGLEEDKRPLLLPALAAHLGSRFADVKKNAPRLLKEIAGRKVDKADDALAVFDAWDETRRLGQRGDPDGIPLVRARLGDVESAPCVRRAAVLAVSRLNAVEAVPDLIDALANPDLALRGLVNHVLCGLVGGDAGFRADGTPTERAQATDRWRASWEGKKSQLLEAQDLRRLVGALGVEARRKEAAGRLAAYGDRAVPALIDALGTPAAYGDAKVRDREIVVLLRQLTGQTLGADRAAWEAWWRTNGRRS